MPPCESATASHSGSSGSPSTVASGATSSPRRRMKPTCGPLPCVTSTRQPASTSSTTCRANAADRSCWRHNEPDSPSCTSALPPIAISTTAWLDHVPLMSRLACRGEAVHRREEHLAAGR